LALDFDAFAIALLLAPFIVALIAPLLSQETGPAAGWILAIVPGGICATLITLIDEIGHGDLARFGVNWVPELGLRFSFLVDGLSLVFGLAVSGIGTIIVIYSGAYLKGHPHRGRFFAIMLAFTGSMLGLVLAENLVTLFVFWELTAVASYLLIGFDSERPAARRAAFQALIVTAIGGLALMGAGVILRVLSGTWTIGELLTAPGLTQAVWSYPIVFALIAIAAFTKSAQIPFHFWLPNAMEAPTPVSAFLHSATMVQAGIYLLARFSPLLSDTWIWQGTLCVIGGATMLWAGVMALKQTDLKQILAQTTIASLGLMVVLLGFGERTAALAVAAYFVAHALYKAGLFLVAGIIDHGTGTRDVTRLSGLRDQLTISFICSALAAISMLGLPPFLGWFAKEEIYADLHTHNVAATIGLVVMVLGNVLIGASALTLGLKPFMGAVLPTPREPHEGAFPLWIGPVIFGLMSLGVVFAVGSYGDVVLAPMAAVISNDSVENHLVLAVDFSSLPIWLSILTWCLSALIYWRIDSVRQFLQAMDRRFTWSFDRGFDAIVLSLVRLAGGWTRLVHHGRLELYLVIVFAALALSIALPMALLDAGPGWPAFQMLTWYEWGGVALMAVGVVAVVMAPTRLTAIVALGVQGLALALLFLFFGAPDLGFTQLLVEVLSVVVLALVMTRLHLSTRDTRPLEDWLRDGTLALICGGAVTLLLMRILQGTFDGRLSAFFAANSLAIAHGRNIVNVILVDFRGLDTLGEIVVVMTAGIAALALLRRQHKRDVLPKSRGSNFT
jgi:multicomponent Na+:H+ antiporter subunit A